MMLSLQFVPVGERGGVYRVAEHEARAERRGDPRGDLRGAQRPVRPVNSAHDRARHETTSKLGFGPECHVPPA